MENIFHINTDQPFPPQLKGRDLDLDDEGQLPVLVYLDVWERHVTSLQERSIREVALGVNENQILRLALRLFGR